MQSNATIRYTCIVSSSSTCAVVSPPPSLQFCIIYMTVHLLMSLCSPSLKPFPLYLSLPSSYPQLLPTPSFLALTLTSHLPSLSSLFFTLSPLIPSILPFSALSILCSLLLLPLPLLPFSSQATMTFQLSSETDHRWRLNLIWTCLWLCMNVDLLFVESLITFFTTTLKTHDGST